MLAGRLYSEETFCFTMQMVSFRVTRAYTSYAMEAIPQVEIPAVPEQVFLGGRCNVLQPE